MVYNEIEELVKMCRLYGITEFKTADVEFKLGPAIQYNSSNLTRLDKANEGVQLTPAKVELQDQDLLFYSTPFYEEKQDVSQDKSADSQS